MRRAVGGSGTSVAFVGYAELASAVSVALTGHPVRHMASFGWLTLVPVSGAGAVVAVRVRTVSPAMAPRPQIRHR